MGRREDYTKWNSTSIEGYVNSVQQKTIKNLFEAIGKLDIENWTESFLKIKSVIEEKNLISFKTQDLEYYWKCLIYFLHPKEEFAKKLKNMDILGELDVLIQEISDKHKLQLIFYELFVKNLSIDSFKILTQNFQLFTPSFKGFIIKRVIKDYSGEFGGIKKEDFVSILEYLIETPLKLSPYNYNIERISDLIYLSFMDLYEDILIEDISFSEDNLTKLDEINDLARKVTYLNKFGDLWNKTDVNLEKILDKVPKSEEILKKLCQDDSNMLYLLGFIHSKEKIKEFLNSNLVPEDINNKFKNIDQQFETTDGTHLLPFIWDDSDENKEYKEIEGLILKEDFDNSKKIILNSNGLNMRMYLLLICYHNFFLKSKSCETLKSVLKDEKIITHLKITKKEKLIYDFYIKGPSKNYEEKDGIFAYQFSEALLKKNEEALVTTHILTNLLAVTLALPSEKNHLYRRTYKLNEMHYNFDSPGSTASTEKDCGYQTSSDGNLITAQNILGQNVLFHATLNTLTWGAFSCSMLVDENNDFYNAANNNQLVIGDWATDIKKQTTSNKTKLEIYIFRRVEGFMGNVKQNLDNKNRYGHYFTISLYNFWKNHSKFKYAQSAWNRGDGNIRNYENEFRDLCFAPSLKSLDEWLLKLREKISQADLLEEIEKFSNNFQNYKIENNVFPKLNQLKQFITENNSNYTQAVLNIDTMKSLYCLPKFIYVYHSLYTNLNKRIKKEELNLEMKQILAKYQWIPQKDWDEFQKLWHQHSGIILTACSQLKLLKAECQDVLETSSTMNETNLLGVFLYTPESSGLKDHFRDLLDAMISLYNKLQIIENDENKPMLPCKIIQDPKTQAQITGILSYPFEKFIDLVSLSHTTKKEFKGDILEKMILMIMNRPKIQLLKQSEDYNENNFEFKVESIVKNFEKISEIGFHQDWSIHLLSSHISTLTKPKNVFPHRSKKNFQNSIKDKSKQELKKTIEFLNRIIQDIPNQNIHSYLYKLVNPLKSEKKILLLSYISSLEKLSDLTSNQQKEILEVIKENQYIKYLEKFFQYKGLINITIEEWSSLFNENINQDLKSRFKEFKEVPIEHLQTIAEMLINTYLETRLEFQMISGEDLFENDITNELERVGEKVKLIKDRKNVISFLQDMISFLIKAPDIQNVENFGKSVYSRFFDKISAKMTDFDQNEKEILGNLISKNINLAQFRPYIKFLNKLLGNLTLESYNDPKNCYQEDVPDFISNYNEVSMESIDIKKENIKDFDKKEIPKDKISSDQIQAPTEVKQHEFEIIEKETLIEDRIVDIKPKDIIKKSFTPSEFNKLLMGDTEKPKETETPIIKEKVDESQSLNGLLITTQSETETQILKESNDFLKWDVQQVVEFIKNIDPQFVQKGITKLFEDNEIDGQALNEIDKDTLIELGVSVVGHRLKILGAIKKLKNE